MCLKEVLKFEASVRKIP